MNEFRTWLASARRGSRLASLSIGRENEELARSSAVAASARGRVSSLRLAALCAGALALAACGGGDDGPGSSDGGDPGTNNPPAGSPPPGGGSGNRAPTISGNPPPQALIGSQFSFVPTASDADGDDLTFEIENMPAWASFDDDTGRLFGTPDEGDQGTYPNIRISVSDGEATASLAAFSIEVVATATGSASLTWTPPTTKTDGSSLDLAGYKIYWGTSSRSYSNSRRVDDAGIVSYVIDQLTPGTWYFAVTAIDKTGLESDYSNEVTKQIL